MGSDFGWGTRAHAEGRHAVTPSTSFHAAATRTVDQSGLRCQGLKHPRSPLRATVCGTLCLKLVECTWRGAVARSGAVYPISAHFVRAAIFIHGRTSKKAPDEASNCCEGTRHIDPRPVQCHLPGPRPKKGSNSAPRCKACIDRKPKNLRLQQPGSALHETGIA